MQFVTIFKGMTQYRNALLLKVTIPQHNALLFSFLLLGGSYVEIIWHTKPK